MLQKILQIIAKEDTFKLFTANAHPSIYEAFSLVQEPMNIREIQGVLHNFFAQIVKTHDPTTFYYTEAARMLAVVDNIFMEMQREYAGAVPSPSPSQPRDLNDEAVDLYMESLRYFASALEEPVLMEHIKYLER